ncbi:hypothetical protein D3C72_358050 [compost metagenome]
MAHKKRLGRFDRGAVLRHAAQHHPNCRAEMVALFAYDISMREWEGSCSAFRLRNWLALLRPGFGGGGAPEGLLPLRSGAARFSGAGRGLLLPESGGPLLA